MKITFHKPENEVFITDYRRYSFLLNHVYIPDTLADKECFDEKMRRAGISPATLQEYVCKTKAVKCRNNLILLNFCEEIERTFDRCITADSDILQGCVWDIRLSEAERIEFLPYDGYCYGSLNHADRNGARKNWQEDFYRRLGNRGEDALLRPAGSRK